MAAGRTTFEKLQRDRAKKAKAEAKRAKRMGKIPQSGPLVNETPEPEGTGAVLDGTIVNVAVPSLSIDLGATTRELQWIVDAYLLVFTGPLLAAGGLGDRSAASARWSSDSLRSARCRCTQGRSTRPVS